MRWRVLAMEKEAIERDKETQSEEGRRRSNEDAMTNLKLCGERRRSD